MIISMAVDELRGKWAAVGEITASRGGRGHRALSRFVGRAELFQHSDFGRRRDGHGLVWS